MPDPLHIRCQRDHLVTILQAADTVPPSNSAKPICMNFQMMAGNGMLELQATDIAHIGLRAILRRVEVVSPGQIIVPARQLVTIIKESVSPTVEMHEIIGEAGSRLQITLVDGDFTLPLVTGEIFPPVGMFPDGLQVIRTPGPSVERMIRNTIFAVDKERTNPALSGVLFTLKDDELLMAATDGKVLSESVYRNPELVQLPPVTTIFPVQTIHHISRVLSLGLSQGVEVAIKDKLIFVRIVIASGEIAGVGNTQIEIISRAIDGTYPPYRNALPNQPIGFVEFRTPDLASAVRRTMMLNTAANRGIIMDLHQDGAVISNMINSGGSGRVPLACSYQGPDERYGFNGNYLQEILKVFGDATMRIELNGRGRGLIIRDGTETTFLIMPIRFPNS